MKSLFNSQQTVRNIRKTALLKWGLLALVPCTLIPLALYASTKGANGMYQFEDGTVISAKEMNINFGYFANAIAVDPAQNVAIGATNPHGRLEIRDSNDTSLYLSATKIHPSQSLSRIYTGYSGTGGWGAGYLRFALDGNGDGVFEDKVAILGNGKVGFGTNAPTATLEARYDGPTDGASGQSNLKLTNLGGGTSDYADLEFDTGSGGSAGIFRNPGSSTAYAGPGSLNMGSSSAINVGIYTNNATRLFVGGDGKVGIGTLSPAQKLHVAGNVQADDYLYNSDLRLKTDVMPLENADKGLDCLQGVTYRWSDPLTDQAVQIGLIAQDVERCFPELVATDANGYKSVSYARLVVPLIENAKHTMAENEAQQKVIVGLQQKTASLEARLARLEARLEK